jgi:hypothetical protein
MGEFVDAALSFPAVLFTFLLVVVVFFWLLVLIGTMDLDIGDVESDSGDSDLMAGLGLGGVPVTVTLSVLIVVAWFVSLAGGVLTAALDLGTFVRVLLGIGVLFVAILAGLFMARLVALPLRKLYVDGAEPSRRDFLGRECVIRTGRVSGDFGQAEVTSEDGSSAIIQVRQTGEHELTNGRRALIFDYDTDGEFFWVAPAT